MKRMWIGTSLLALLILAGLLTGAVLNKRVDQAAQQLTTAGEAAQAEEWGKASALIWQVKADWEQMKWAAEALSDHERLNQIDTAFSQLPAYAGNDPSSYQALCIAIAQDLQLVAKNHTLSWRNFF